MNSEDELINGTFGKARRFLGLASQIHVYKSNRKSDKIYGTVIHELAHSAHWGQGNIIFTFSEEKVKESWARGVQWFLTKTVYDGYIPSYSKVKYTGVVQDMMDSDKTNTKVTESVSGYTISQIENALIGKKKWSEWRGNIKAKYNNSTEIHIDALLNHWD